MAAKDRLKEAESLLATIGAVDDEVMEAQRQEDEQKRILAAAKAQGKKEAKEELFSSQWQQDQQEAMVAERPKKRGRPSKNASAAGPAAHPVSASKFSSGSDNPGFTKEGRKYKRQVLALLKRLPEETEGAQIPMEDTDEAWKTALDELEAIIASAGAEMMAKEMFIGVLQFYEDLSVSPFFNPAGWDLRGMAKYAQATPMFNPELIQLSIIHEERLAMNPYLRLIGKTLQHMKAVDKHNKASSGLEQPVAKGESERFDDL